MSDGSGAAITRNGAITHNGAISRNDAKDTFVCQTEHLYRMAQTDGLALKSGQLEHARISA